MLQRSLLRAKNIQQLCIRNSHRDGGVPGENLPFGLTNKYKLTFLFGAFLGSGFAIPFLAVRHQLCKNAS